MLPPERRGWIPCTPGIGAVSVPLLHWWQRYVVRILFSDWGCVWKRWWIVNARLCERARLVLLCVSQRQLRARDVNILRRSDHIKFCKHKETYRSLNLLSLAINLSSETALSKNRDCNTTAHKTRLRTREIQRDSCFLRENLPSPLLEQVSLLAHNWAIFVLFADCWNTMKEFCREIDLGCPENYQSCQKFDCPPGELCCCRHWWFWYEFLAGTLGNV